MASLFQMLNWYWDVLDTNHGTHVYSSASDTFVVVGDATYVTWLAADGGNTPTVIATGDELWERFDNYARTSFRESYGPFSTSADLTLSGPIDSLTVVTETGVAKKVILPTMRSPRAPPIGYTFSIKNSDSSTETFTLYKADGSTSIRDLKVSDRLNLILVDNSTSNGTFELDPPPTSDIIYSGWIGYTPTITAVAGTFTTVSSAALYKRVGKVVFVQISITITTNGTAATAVVATLPATPFASVSTGVGMRSNDAKGLHGLVNSAGSTVTIYLYDGTYPGGGATTLFFSLVYNTSDA